MIKVIKRDGRTKAFDKRFIQVAVSRAECDVREEDTDLGLRIAQLVEESLVKDSIDEIGIEDIQDLVLVFLDREDKEVAKAYKDFRDERTFQREANSRLYEEIEGIFNQTSEEVVNNANKSGDKLQTYRAMISDVACSCYADSKIIPAHILKEHEKSIYIHDKSYLPIPVFNCILVNWMDMLKNGFHMGSTFISTPKSITTAVALLSQIISHTTSNTYGGNTLGDLDIGLEPYIQMSYDKHLAIAKTYVCEDKQEEYAWNMLEKEVYSAVQGLEYEITTLMNSRGEQPFETITFGRGTSKFAQLFQKAYLETRYKGFTDGTTPVFPKICFFLERGVNLEPDDPQYYLFKLAVRCSSVRMYPKVKIGA